MLDNVDCNNSHYSQLKIFINTKSKTKKSPAATGTQRKYDTSIPVELIDLLKVNYLESFLQGGILKIFRRVAIFLTFSKSKINHCSKH